MSPMGVMSPMSPMGPMGEKHTKQHKTRTNPPSEARRCPDGALAVGLEAAVAQPAIHSKAHTHVWRLLSLFDTIMEKTIKI